MCSSLYINNPNYLNVTIDIYSLSPSEKSFKIGDWWIT